MDPEAAAKRLESLKEANKDSIGFIEVCLLGTIGLIIPNAISQELLEQNKTLSDNLEEMKIVYNSMIAMCRDRELLQSKIKEAESRLVCCSPTCLEYS